MCVESDQELPGLQLQTNCPKCTLHI
jgi:hypothetical protein